MNLLKILMTLYMAAALGGCASTATSAHLTQVREFAAASTMLNTYAELTTRFRDTYTREQPYLTVAADQRERLIDAQRNAASDDFLKIGKSVALYMHMLGMLAGGAAADT